MSEMEKWEVVIGLETHVQLLTQSKIFSGASTAFGAEPNRQACPIDLGLPGVLPSVNEKVYEKAIAFALGVGATINRRSTFDRKSYFYPDLPKGYQITQLAAPILLNGSVDTVLADGSAKTVQITRAHLEEDAGKSLHEDIHGMSGIDLNRAGTPLLEIVSEPDMRSAEEAVAYARQIHQLVTWLEVSDGDMSQGSMRCDVNVSIRPRGSSALGTRTETKNINSFRFLGRAIEHEISRQIEVLESGGRIVQETRLYDPDNDETRSMRSKETAMDYRYFPEPDLLPVEIDDAYIERIRSRMPELPHEKKARFEEEYKLNERDARALASDRHLSDYFEKVVAACGDETLAANWVRVELLGRLNKEDLTISQAPVPAAETGRLISRINDQTISGKIAKSVFDALWRHEAKTADEYIEAHGLTQVSDMEELEPIVDTIIADNPKQVKQYKAGKTKVLGFFVGQVMKATGGKANPQQVNDIIQRKLAD